MTPRHGVALLAFLGWSLVAPGSTQAAGAKPKLATYTSETYGFSFQYPSDWTLKEGDEAKLNWGYIGQVDVHLPQGVTIAAVVMADNSYPESDLQIAFLNASVDTSLAPALCNAGTP